MSWPSPPLEEQIGRVRSRLFVGREAELARLERLLEPGDGPRVAYVWGPGGVGKTELLVELRRRGRGRGVAVAWLDAGPIPCSEVAFAAAAEAVLARDGASLLLIDRFEAVEPLETWFREHFLPSLGADVRVVCAGRAAPAPTWRASSAWHGLLDAFELPNLGTGVATEYLARRGVPEPQREAVARVTRGHPLALALFADVVLRHPERPPTLEGHPDEVQALLDNLLEGLPEDLQRHALWVAALVQHTTEALLADVVDASRAAGLFDWLRSLSFMRASAAGLAPHDLVRDLLAADLSWRHPRLRGELLVRAARHYRAELRAHSTGRVDTLLAVGFLVKEQMPFLEHDASDLYASAVRPTDWPDLEAMVLAHEGPGSYEALRRWAERGGELVVVRGESGSPQGFALYLWLDQVTPEAAAEDPGVDGLYRYLAQHSELSGSLYMRLAMDKDVYQAPAPLTLVISAYALERFVPNPDLRYAFSAWSRPELGLQGLPEGMLEHCEAADFTLDGRHYAVIGTANHGKPFLEWFIDGAFAPVIEATGPPDPDALDRAALRHAVRMALRDYHRPERLVDSPLTRLGLVAAGAAASSPMDTIERVRELLREACEAQRQGDPDDRGYAALERTFLSGHGKQLRVAADLNLPYSTYRRHLTNALERLTDWLWLREQGLDDPPKS